MRSRIPSVVAVVVSTMSLVGILVLDPGELVPWGFPTLAALVVAAILTWRLPRHPIGWLLLVFATTSSTSALLITLALYPADATAAGWLDAIGNAINTAGVLALPAILLRFPEGRLLSPRWKWAEALVFTTSGVGFVAALLNGGWGGDVLQAVEVSPLYAATSPLGDTLSGVFYTMMSFSMVSAAVSLIVRYRRSVGDERIKIKWLAYSGGFLIATFILLSVTDTGVTLDAPWETILAAFAFSLIPIAIGVAILKYRLYDIDVVINRTVVLALLAGFITAVYALIVVGIGAIVGGGSDGLALPIAATAVVAIVFEPFRHLAQRWANRLVYGRRSTPYEVLSNLTEQLSASEAGEGILERVAALLKDGTGADRATVWLGGPGEMKHGATSPPDAIPSGVVRLDDEFVFPVTHHDAVVGALEVVKPKGTSLSSVERALVTDLAGSVGLVLGYQHLNDSLAERAREVDQSRHRLVEAQDQERRRLERDLHDGAQQQLVALKVKIGIARKVAGQRGEQDLENLLAGLGEEAQLAVDEIRSLAKGIYPPVLESDGLVAAISSLASAAPVPVTIREDGVGRYPAEVEAAIYFNASEAVTNAIKHGSPPIHIELVDSDGVLRFEVTDSGSGFNVAEMKPGSGMNNMSDRLDALGGEMTVISSVGEGTTIQGKVPIPKAVQPV